MASEASGANLHPPGMPPPDWKSINSKSSSPATHQDSAMRDEDSQPPSYLYSPLLHANDGTLDHIGTPYASNKAHQTPLVSLQPKSRHDKNQAQDDPSASPNAIPTTGSQTKTTTSLRPNQAGRGASLRRPNPLNTVPTITPNHNALAPAPKTHLHEDGYTLVNNKTMTRALSTQKDMQVSGILITRVGPKKELETQSIQFGTMLQALISINPHIPIHMQSREYPQSLNTPQMTPRLQSTDGHYIG